MKDSKRLQTPRAIRLEADQAAHLARIAKREKRSLSSAVRVLLDEALLARGITKAREAAA